MTRNERTKRSSGDLVVGVDEAGYGPTLGPLVVAATLWDVPRADEGPAVFDFYETFAGVVSAERAAAGVVHVADSKAVHKANAGIGALERTAETVLSLAGRDGRTDDALFAALSDDAISGDPCRDGEPLELPRAADAEEIASLATAWGGRCDAAGVRLVDVAARIVVPRVFNEGVARSGSKGEVLTRTTLGLVAEVLGRRGVTLGEAPAGGRRVVVFADKHGGRSRYAGPLAEAAGGVLPAVLSEARGESRYAFPGVEVRFSARGESAMPVAAASCVAKYLRELAMERFNRFWAGRVPGVKPTKGYPVDAARFLAEIGPSVAAAGVDERALRRNR